MIDGVLTNATGQRLEDVYIAFKYPTGRINTDDWLLFLNSWNPGVSINLSQEFLTDQSPDALPLLSRQAAAVPGGNNIMAWPRASYLAG